MKYYVKSESESLEQIQELSKGLSDLIGSNMEWFATEAVAQEELRGGLEIWPAIITVVTDDGKETDWEVSRQIEFTYHARKAEEQ